MRWTARGRVLGAEDVASEFVLSTRAISQSRDEATSLRGLKEEAKLELAKVAMLRGRAPIKRIAELPDFAAKKASRVPSGTGLAPRRASFAASTASPGMPPSGISPDAAGVVRQRNCSKISIGWTARSRLQSISCRAPPIVDLILVFYLLFKFSI
jgi:hypothetical protein